MTVNLTTDHPWFSRCPLARERSVMPHHGGVGVLSGLLCIPKRVGGVTPNDFASADSHDVIVDEA
ncbi:hypothetical protein [Tahibacter amnicola]|uniref:Uncharacterized protein n=1 Tax=Tahibacter amnicola TaxID=2976241 RepID=A0ABY6BHD5_9GAMM|nr:hypothetical protein [Tahibacter amnicola]UXI69441.1 hypothetical protein N4264_07275 [Tahibacter amnicola]